MFQTNLLIETGFNLCAGEDLEDARIPEEDRSELPALTVTLHGVLLDYPVGIFAAHPLA